MQSQFLNIRVGPTWNIKKLKIEAKISIAMMGKCIFSLQNQRKNNYNVLYFVEKTHTGKRMDNCYSLETNEHT